MRRALLGSLVLAILVGTVPAGIALHHRLSKALLETALRDLSLAPRVLSDRTAAMGDALMMHAKELVHDERLSAAVMRGDRASALQTLASQRGAVPNGIPVVVGADAATWSGPPPSRTLIDATRAGKMPVDMAADLSGVHYFSLAPIERQGRWMGAAGFAVPMNEDAAHVLAGLTRTQVVILAHAPDAAVATTLDAGRTATVSSAIARAPEMYRAPREIGDAADRLLVTSAPLGADGGAGTVVFARVVDEELAILPSLRKLAVGLAALSFAASLLLGAWLTTEITRPVQQLSQAARAFGAGATDVAVPVSRLEDIATVARAFDEMRRALAGRLTELRAANRSLQDHSTRLAALQSDLLQRARLDAATMMVAQLAHEVRNPVASLRNLLELIRRRSAGDHETAEYADLAIDELLRMHELAERMLDLNRPSARTSGPANPFRIATEVARLSTIGSTAAEVVVAGDQIVTADIGGDALKQVLLNLVQNAREAMHSTGLADGRAYIDIARASNRIAIVVRDDGPGIAPEVLPRVFDPFVTTKQRVHGVGLGLYVAESAIRAAGGTISACNRQEGGAMFTIALPLAGDAGGTAGGPASGTAAGA